MMETACDSIETTECGSQEQNSSNETCTINIIYPTSSPTQRTYKPSLSPTYILTPDNTIVAGPTREPILVPSSDPTLMTNPTLTLTPTRMHISHTNTTDFSTSVRTTYELSSPSNDNSNSKNNGNNSYVTCRSYSLCIENATTTKKLRRLART